MSIDEEKNKNTILTNSFINIIFYPIKRTHNIISHIYFVLPGFQFTLPVFP